MNGSAVLAWRVGRRRVGWPGKRQRAIKTKVRATRFKGRPTAGRVLLVDRRLPQWSIAAPAPRVRPARVTTTRPALIRSSHR